MALPPGPREPSFLQLLQFTQRPLPWLDACARRYGDPFTARFFGLGTFVLVSAPELIKQIFTGDPDQLHAGEANAILAPVLGKSSVLLLDGRPHLRQRRLLSPPLRGERMFAYADLIADITADAITHLPRREPFALHPVMQSITLDVILRAVFGLTHGARMAELRALLVEMLEPPPAIVAFLPPKYLDFPFSPYRTFMTRLRAVDRKLYAILRARMASAPAAPTAAATPTPTTAATPTPTPTTATAATPTASVATTPTATPTPSVATSPTATVATSPTATDPSGDDILSLLLAARDDQGIPMTIDELRDELITMLIAGHETTATALSWTFACLLEHPDVGARLSAELKRAIVPDGRGNHALDPEALSSLDYLDAVIKETLRLRPILPDVVRKLQSPIDFAGFRIPAGVSLTPCIHLAHRRPDNYPDPLAFRPERWLGTRVDPYAWLPFGGGIRRCLGMAFALYEMKIVVGTLWSQLHMRLARPGPVRVVRRTLTLAPERGTLVMIEGSRRTAA